MSGSRLLGRSFLHPALDYLLVGGGLSLLFAAAAWRMPALLTGLGSGAMGGLLLFSVVAHFAASTVRLYAKPQAFELYPGPTLVFPMIALAVTWICIQWAEPLGPALQGLYLTWSPYHYAAQAYGLAVMYSYRSGCALGDGDKRLLRLAALATFFWVFVHSQNAGLQWLLPVAWLREWPWLETGLTLAQRTFACVAVVAPVAVYAKVWRSPSGPMPLIAPLLLFANLVWWYVLGVTLHAFVWATVFHGIQYVVIVTIFHVRDRVADPTDTRSPARHALWFYAMCLALGYALFKLVPLGFEGLGYGAVEATLVVAAVINLHHFIVDGYIWKLGRSDSNRRVVDASASSPQPIA